MMETRLVAWHGAHRLHELLAMVNQRHLARELNMDPSTLSKYASGDRSPDPDTLARLCRALNVSADFIIGIELAERPDSPSPDALRIAAALEHLAARLESMSHTIDDVRDALAAARGPVSYPLVTASNREIAPAPFPARPPARSATPPEPEETPTSPTGAPPRLPRPGD